MKVYARLLHMIAPFQIWLALAALLTFLTIGSTVGLMSMSAYLISKAAVTTGVAELAIAITTVRVFAILRAVFRYLERVVSHRTTFQILAHLRVWFYAAIEPLAPARLEKHRSGDLLARSVADIDSLQSFYVRVVVPPVAAVLVTALTCAILGAFSATLALVLLAFVLLTGVCLPATTHWLGKERGAQLIATRAELNAQLVDEIQGSADLLVFDQAGDHHARVLTLSRELSRTQERIALLRSIGSGLGVLFASLAGIAILWLAVPLVTGGQIDGVYLALLPLAAIASFEAIQPLSASMQQLESNHSAGRRLFELIDAPPDVLDPARPARQPSDHNIDVQDLSFRYGLDEPLAIERLSFSVPDGSRLAIVGPSGSGKSTILNLLLRFWDYADGRITLGGQDLRDYRADDVRAMFSVVPQDIHLFNASVRDNLLLANPDASDNQIMTACRQALLHNVIQRLPQGYDTPIGENGFLLSGGERQRLAAARAILKDAPILILDEPTANLDAQTEGELLSSLESFMSGRTVIIISHRRAVLRHVDQIVELRDGRIANRTVATSVRPPEAATSTRPT